jgi:hypothetical protein
MCFALPFAADAQFAVRPVDVIELKRRDFAAAQPKPSQEQQHRVITSTGSAAAIATAQQSPQL